MREMLVAVAMLLIVGWGVLPNLRRMQQQEGRGLGQIRGEEVSRADVYHARTVLQLVLRLGLMDARTYMSMAYGGVNPGTQSFYVLLFGPFRQFVFPEGSRLTREPVWRYLVLLREAEKAGVEATMAETELLLAAVPQLREGGDFSRDRYARFLSSTRYRDAVLTHSFNELARILKLIAARRAAVLTTYPERWMTYAFRNEQARIRFVALEGELFAPLVEPSEEELRAFYEERKDRLPDPDEGTYGYMAPERVRLEYAIAPVEQIAEGVEVSQEEIGAYYEENKDEYAVPEESPGQQTSYRSLDEVRGQILEELTMEKAREEAYRRVEAAMADLAAAGESYGGGPQPLGQMARRHELRYEVARIGEGRELLSRQEVTERVPAGARVAELAFGPQESLYFPTQIAPPDGPFMIVQVLEHRSPEQQEFPDVEEQVRQDYRVANGLDRAVTFAEKVKALAAKEGLADAAEQMRSRLTDLLAGAGAPAQESEEPLLAVEETEVFTRTTRRVPGLGAEAPEVVKQSFALEPGELAVVREGQPASRAYVIEVLERRPASQEDFAQAAGYLHTRELNVRQRRELGAWMHGLLEQSEPSPDFTG